MNKKFKRHCTPLQVHLHEIHRQKFLAFQHWGEFHIVLLNNAWKIEGQHSMKQSKNQLVWWLAKRFKNTESNARGKQLDDT